MALYRRILTNYLVRNQTVPESPKRDRARTESVILEAALEEFLKYGRAGARIDRIASAAGVNKANIYHYFGSKDGLLDALLTNKLGAVNEARDTKPASLAESLVFFQEQQYADAEWIKLATWEALEYTGSPAIAEDERSAAWQPLVNGIKQQIKEGKVPKMDAAQLQLTWVAIVTFPIAFPQFTKMITGLGVDSSEFQKRRKQFLRRFADAFLSE